MIFMYETNVKIVLFNREMFYQSVKTKYGRYYEIPMVGKHCFSDKLIGCGV